MGSVGDIGRALTRARDVGAGMDTGCQGQGRSLPTSAWALDLPPAPSCTPRCTVPPFHVGIPEVLLSSRTVPETREHPRAPLPLRGKQAGAREASSFVLRVSWCPLRATPRATFQKDRPARPSTGSASSTPQRPVTRLPPRRASHRSHQGRPRPQPNALPPQPGDLGGRAGSSDPRSAFGTAARPALEAVSLSPSFHSLDSSFSIAITRLSLVATP